MRKPSMGGRQHWVMLVDEATKYKKSFFLKKKNEQVEPIIDWIKALKARHKIQVKIIRCDNAGENKVLERESDKKELGIIFEYTVPGTPQENGVVERAFVTVMGRARAMVNHAGFTMAKRQQLWCEAAQTATMLDNILVQESAKSPPFTQFFGVDAKYAKHLRGFGEICVVADTDNKVGRTKIDPRGKISLFVGYSTQHAGDVYRPHLPLPPYLLFVLPVIITYMWLNNLGVITHSHSYNWTSFDHCVELWVISLLEISHIFPLIVVDISELSYLCRSKRVVYRPCYSYC